MVSINDLLPPARGQGPTGFTPLPRRAQRTLLSRRQEYDLRRPSSDERDDQIRRTQEALDALIAARTGAADPSPRTQTVEYRTAGEERSRSLRIVEQQNDPLEPPRHRYKKEYKTTPVSTDTAAPVMRQEQRLSPAEKQKWAVPASVSNWKNPRGFVIDLDKRAAADRGMVQTTSTKHSDLVAALEAAGDDVQSEREAKLQEDRQFEEQQRLKLRLLAQKAQGSQKRGSTDESRGDDDLFDSRLYHKSKRRHGVYDGPLFAAAQDSARRPFHPAHRALPEQQQLLDELRPVEFEEH